MVIRFVILVYYDCFDIQSTFDKKLALSTKLGRNLTTNYFHKAKYARLIMLCQLNICYDSVNTNRNLDLTRLVLDKKRNKF